MRAGSVGGPGELCGVSNPELRMSLEALVKAWVTRRAICPGELVPKVIDLICDTLHLFEAIEGFLGELDDVVDIGTGIGVPGLPLALAVAHLSSHRPRFTLVDRSSRELKVCAGALSDLRARGYLKDVKVIVLKGEASELRELLELGRTLWLARAVARPPEVFELIGEVASPGHLFAWQYSSRWREWLSEARASGWSVLSHHRYVLRTPRGERERYVVMLRREGGPGDEREET